MLRLRVVDRSMEPTLSPGRELQAIPFRAGDLGPRRGAIVVVRDPERSRRWLVKRVAAVAGDRLWYGPDGVRAVPRGHRLDVRPPGRHRFLEGLQIPRGWLFLISDRLESGRDSRKFGAVPVSSVVGIVSQRADSERRGDP